MAEASDAGNQANRTPSAHCPDAEVWASVCGGLMPSDEADALLIHASQCSHCGPILRQASAVFNTEATPEEEEVLGRLQSSGDAWSRRVARRLQDAAKVTPGSGTKRESLNWVLWPAFFTVVAAALLLIRTYRINHSVEHLLALAYDQQRRTDLWLPGGNPVPVWSPERGNNTSEPAGMLEARLAAERGLEAHPDNAQWYEARAQVSVVAMEPKQALVDLQIAQLRDPNLPRIEFDLGTAYFELGEQEGKASDYGFAAEHFSRYLAPMHRRDPIALYNRALCWERSGVLELAERDLGEALNLERNQAWRAAIEDQIRSLKGSGESRPSRGSSALHLQADRPDDYEGKLHIALDKDSGGGNGTDQFILKVADLGRAHRDAWLQEWLEASQRRPSHQADAALAAADRDNSEGKSDEALYLAEYASDRYRAAGNKPGILRAEAEAVYSLRRSGHPRNSLDRLARVENNRALARYAWLFTFLTLEKASCLSQLGRFDEASADAQRGQNLASLAHLPVLEMRARGYIAGFLTSQGLGDVAWARNVAGLEATEDPATGAMQRYQFLSDLSMDASLLGLSYTAATLSRAAATMASSTGNLQIEAYAAELEGRDEVAAAELTEAADAFRLADTRLASLTHGAPADIYHADWATDRAELVLAEGDGNRATATLDQALPVINASGNLWIAFKYWTGRAHVESQEHHEAEALTSARKAVDCAIATLRAMKTADERRAWDERAESAWSSMIDALLSVGRNREALSEWLWFRAAPEQSLMASSDPLRFAQAAEESAQRKWTGAVVLVFLRIQDAYVAFVMPERGQIIHAVKIPLSASRVDQMARIFTMLCADPRTPQANVAEHGRRLYDILLAPVIGRRAAEIRIDAPGALKALPFAALTDDNGDYLGSSARIAALPAWWAAGASHPAEPVTPASRLLLIDAAESSAMPRIPAGVDEARALAAMFHDPEVISGGRESNEITTRLRSAEIFHFTGHATTREGVSELKLGETSGTQSAVLTPASLDRIRLPRCALAFLAACSTFGDQTARIEESYTLPDAFLRAGAIDVIGTRWDVDSAASRRLVLSFYSAYLKGKNPAAALQTAQASLRADPAFVHPYYWAAFSLLEQ